MFKVNDFVVCNNNEPGLLSKQATLQKNKIYVVIATYRNGIMVNDGTTGFWHVKKFKKHKPSFAEQLINKIISDIKLTELLTTKLNSN